MTIKRLKAALLAAAAVALLFTGCGKKEEAPASTAMPDRMPPVDQSELAVPGEVPDVSEELAALVDEDPSAEPVAEAAPEAAPVPAATQEMSAEPVPAPTAVPTPAPTATPVPPPFINASPAATPKAEEAAAEPEPAADELRPGTYEGVDGSILTVNADGTCTLVTEVSGKINGKAMSADLTFHGTVEKGEFSFDKVTYGAIDLTAIAAAAGYSDAAPWETTAELIYAAG